MSEDRFNLRDVIRSIIASNSKIWPIDEVVIEVVDTLDGDDLREALRQALPCLVREILAEHRPQGRIGLPTHNVTGRREVRPPAAHHPVGRSRSITGSSRGSFDNVTSTTPMNGSRKGNEIRDAWQRVLDARYAVAGGDHKRLGDCTYNDLFFMANQLDVQSADLQSRARGFRELAMLINDYDVSTLRELPAEVLMNTLGGK